MDKNDLTTSQLLRQWYAGEKQALDALLNLHLPWIQAYAHKNLSDFLRLKADTGDIVQDAVVQFLKFGPRFHMSSNSQFRALLCRIIKNVIHDKYDWFTAMRRSVSRERPLSSETVLNLDHDQATPSRIVQKDEQDAWVRFGLELLNPDDRQMIVLRDWEELSFAQIGEKLSLTKDTARRRYLASLNRLIEKVRMLRKGKIGDLLSLEEEE